MLRTFFILYDPVTADARLPYIGTRVVISLSMTLGMMTTVLTALFFHQLVSADAVLSTSAFDYFARFKYTLISLAVILVSADLIIGVLQGMFFVSTSLGLVVTAACGTLFMLLCALLSFIMAMRVMKRLGSVMELVSDANAAVYRMRFRKMSVRVAISTVGMVSDTRIFECMYNVMISIALIHLLRCCICMMRGVFIVMQCIRYTSHRHFPM